MNGSIQVICIQVVGRAKTFLRNEKNGNEGMPPRTLKKDMK